jgi:hypothetical protein
MDAFCRYALPQRAPKLRNASPAATSATTATSRSRRVIGEPRIWPRARDDSNDPRAANESADATEQADPIESSEPAEPIDPTESTEPTEPIDSTEPSLAIERIEPSDLHDHRDSTPRLYSCPPGGRSQSAISRRDELVSRDDDELSAFGVAVLIT